MLIFLTIIYIPIVLLLLLQWKIVSDKIRYQSKIQSDTVKINWSDTTIKYISNLEDKRYVG